MTSQWADNDDRLMAALGDAVRAAQAVPASFTEAGRAAYTWHGIDAELAALTFDSAAEPEAVPAIRAEEASPRFLSFAAPDLTIELEIGPDAIVGQIVPPQPGHADACPASGPAFTAEIDDVGCFVIRPLPASPFRLHCHTSSEISALTTWITL
ncbi:MAG TPA: hypothetical protein VMH35_23120 [Streptosporangiaceae bacterium]|nr:hypothetical protein [Streptosporangiaceae bacterium]